MPGSNHGSFDATPVNVQEILGAQRQVYECPLFQRKYSWGEDQWTDFWADLDSVLDDKTQRRFLGALVLQISEHTSLKSPGRIWLVDGQQRLITIYLTLLACADLSHEHGDDALAAMISNDFLTLFYKMPPKRFPRLEPTIGDLSAFLDIHQSFKDFRITGIPLPGKSSKGTKLHSAYSYQKNEIRKRIYNGGEFDEKKLIQLFEAITERLDFVAIYLDDTHDPQEVFDRLNQGGKRLSLSDLLKNRLFGVLRNKRELYPDAAEIEKFEWKEFVDGFADATDEQTSLLTEYIFPFSLCINRTSTKGKAIDLIERHWNEKFHDADELEQMKLRINDLRSYQEEFLLISGKRQVSDLPQDFARCLSRLVRMDPANAVFAYVMQLTKSVQSGVSEVSAASKCIAIIDSFLVRRAIVGIEPTGLHAVFKDLWFKCRDQPEDVRKSLQTGTVIFPSNSDFRKACLNVNLYSRRKCTLILKEYETYLREKSPEDYKSAELSDLVNVQVDHLLPKGIGKGWIGVVPKGKEDHLNRWGNLVLITSKANKVKSRKSWAEAKKLLEVNSKFLQTRELFVEFSEWNLDSIQTRTIQLTNWALERWSENP